MLIARSTATWEKRWKKSSWKQSDGTAADFKWTAGPFYGNEEEDKGIQTSTDARFYALYSEFSKVFNNKGKDLVLQVRWLGRMAGHHHPPQFQVRHPQELDCGGGYIKVLPASRY